MRPFTIGEEVLYGGERFVINTVRPQEPYQFCIIRTGEHGAKILWVTEAELSRLDRYIEQHDDTMRV